MNISAKISKKNKIELKKLLKTSPYSRFLFDRTVIVIIKTLDLSTVSI